MADAIPCQECARRPAFGWVRITYVRDGDALPPAMRAFAGRSAERQLCRRCLRERTDADHFKVEWLGVPG